MAKLSDRDAVYAAADGWRQRCLLADGSVFGQTSLWTGEHAAELVRHFIDQPDEGKRSFEEKLKDQLEGASTEAIQLAAEMLWVMMLFPSNTKRERKIELVRTVWNWSGVPLTDAHHALDALDMGIGSGGIGYNNYRPFELQLIIRFTRAWKQLDRNEQVRLAGDAWAFVDWFDRLPDAPSRQLRHMLLHLLFPNDFERVASTNDKRRIDKAFGKLLQDVDIAPGDRGPSAIARDRRLRRIRTVLEAEHPGLALDFYETPDVKARWQDSSTKQDEPADQATLDSGPMSPSIGSHVWVIGAAESAARWLSFYEDGIIAIGWDELGDLQQYTDRSAMHAAIKRMYESERDPWNDSLACYQFCHGMTVGDAVYVKQGRDRILGYGRVQGGYEYDESRPDYRNIRRVEWIRRGNWTLPKIAHVPPKTLTDVTNFAAFVEFVREQIGEGAPTGEAPAPYDVDDVMRVAFLSRDAVEQILASVKRRKNLILQGPPGVGKSFLARKLAYALVGAEAPDNVQMIQFHQSYAYEDFIQGWRPNGHGGFVLRSGVFFEFCRRAQDHPGEPHVFIIDEINRGNLSKIFGELLLLIEADKRGPEYAIQLTYAESATDTFYIPDNVYVVGLMNTADRSLAMVDYALRRRFAFKTLQPAYDSPAFGHSLSERGVDDATISHIIDRVGAVNKEIIGDHKNLGPGFAIGHSYFCPTADVENPAEWYAAIVDEEIEPLLTEYWFDDAKSVERCLKILVG